jgi:hypothetical protein
MCDHFTNQDDDEDEDEPGQQQQQQRVYLGIDVGEFYLPACVFPKHSPCPAHNICCAALCYMQDHV